MENKEVIETLENELGVSEHEAKELSHGLSDALGYHKDVGVMYYSETTVKEYRASIQKTYDAIRNLNFALKNIPESEKLVIDDYYREANNSDTLMIDLANEAMFETGEPQSGFQQISQRMEKALKIAEENIRTPGAGNSRRGGKEYIAAIEMLARWFSDVLPDHNLSATPNTPFYKYVQLWFQCFIDPDDNDKDIRRHISNTLKHPNILLHHDKGSK